MKKTIHTNLIGRRAQLIDPAYDRESIDLACRQDGWDEERIRSYIAHRMSEVDNPSWNEQHGEIVAVYLDDDNQPAAVVAVDDGHSADVPVLWCRLEAVAEITVDPQLAVLTEIRDAIRQLADSVVSLECNR